MSQLFKRISVGTAIVGAGVLLLGWGCYAVGVRINTTKSIPIGLYWTSSKIADKGSYVLFCPPEVSVFVEARRRGYIGPGFCPGNFGFLMKRVLAAKNDVVSIADDGVRVNGDLLQFSAPKKFDKAGRPLFRYHRERFTLGDAEVFLMSDVSNTSFDGRYFGPVNRSQIQSVVFPVLTW